MSNNETNVGMSRRNLLIGMGAAAATAYAGSALSAAEGHDHSKHKTKKPDLLGAVNNCTDRGERCIAHCLVSFQEGDTELADCASKVTEMIAICNGFSYLVAANSSYNKDYAAVCKQVCEDCAEECRKHDQHYECKDCAEACEKLVKKIDKAYG